MLEFEYDIHYAPTPDDTPAVPVASQESPQKINFFSRYMKQQPGAAEKKHELKEYFRVTNVPDGPFDKVDPLQWWFSRRDQFPHLYRLARDILCIPGEFRSILYCFSLKILHVGSAVAVERIFSGGRDTIGLRRSSLKADTIQTLMVVKARLRLARTAIIELLGDE
jgi:hypothetical protein